ncbi:MAG: pyridinium-3,5-bisthiocarboxylic acid mononucleotide nickel chelatase [Acidobacteriota bacterium]|nr:pyridinium-3,5-bisthiocarboxylic acid mononucleotide nickel chelatase [Acidobacteriota bacterium]
MILGALVSVGVEPRALVEQLSLLNVSGYEIDFETVDRSGISATHARVRTRDEHAHRHLGDILKIIYESRLSGGVKDRAAHIFSRLGEAEARIHNVPIERIHFHEVGALDAIIDVVGACIGFELLEIEHFVCSELHVGSGMVEMAHGRFPIPPPAVAELLKGAPVYSSDIKGELVTPTGAAIISTVCREYGSLPKMKVERIGYGAGTREYQNFPNVLRLMLGDDAAIENFSDERLLVVETNIDDMSPQIYGHLMERAFALGALDCYFTPVQMKKNRPGVLVSILCKPAECDVMCELLLNETTTLGVRFFEVQRRSLTREIVSVETEFGAIDVKVARMNGRVLKGMPEYEHCRAAAQKANVSLQTVEQAARDSFVKLRGDG